MALLSDKPYSLAARTLTQALECMLAVIIHTECLLVFSIRSSRITMEVIRKKPNM